jgi:cytoskeletal protein RodZ
LSPEEIFRLTRVRTALLEAAEGDVLSSLPEDPYTRSLYATLARVTGADVQAVLASYDRLRATRDAVIVERGAASPPPRRERPLGLVLGLGALGVLLLCLWLFGHVKREPAGPGASAGRVAEVEGGEGAPAGASQPEAAPPGDLPATAETAGPAGLAPVRPHRVAPPQPGDPGTGAVPDWPMLPLESDPPAPAGAGSADSLGQAPPVELVLQAEALADSWIRVVTDGARARSGILPRGESRVWRGTREIRLDIADAGGVRLALNGRPVELAAGESGVLHLSFTPDLVGPEPSPGPMPGPTPGP